MLELNKIQEQVGAVFNDNGVPLSFNNDEVALEAINNGAILCDRSAWGLLQITGEDRLRYLHNQSTNDFTKLKPREGCDTVFVTSTARTLDLATAYVTADAVWVLLSPNRREQLFKWLDGFIFPFDQVELKDMTTEYAIFSLIGARSATILRELGLQHLSDLSNYHHDLETIDDISFRVAAGSGIGLPGYTLIVPVVDAGTIWSKIIATGVIPAGDRVWEQLRIQQGRPSPEKELTEDYNPLEAGLWHTLSFDKGCYIGQETIARLNTYKGVKQRLWGIKLSQGVAPGTEVMLEGKKVGVLTSYTDTAQGSFGLAYVRTKAGGKGLQVQVGEATGTLVSVPFIRHED